MPTMAARALSALAAVALLAGLTAAPATGERTQHGSLIVSLDDGLSLLKLPLCSQRRLRDTKQAEALLLRAVCASGASQERGERAGRRAEGVQEAVRGSAGRRGSGPRRR
jgi:hypothetical protein